MNKLIRFLEEIDKLKNVQRQTLLMDGSRRENSAEHSWNLALAVLLFAEEANEEFDRMLAVKMALYHDLVEVYAGDTFVYDTEGEKDKIEREKAALEKLLGHLPEGEFRADLKNVWEAFEFGDSPEARFVRSLDRFLPLLQNWKTEGHTWQKHGISKERVLARNKHIAEGSEKLWTQAQEILNEAEEKGWLKSEG